MARGVGTSSFSGAQSQPVARKREKKTLTFLKAFTAFLPLRRPHQGTFGVVCDHGTPQRSLGILRLRSTLAVLLRSIFFFGPPSSAPSAPKLAGPLRGSWTSDRASLAPGHCPVSSLLSGTSRYAQPESAALMKFDLYLCPNCSHGHAVTEPVPLLPP